MNFGHHKAIIGIRLSYYYYYYYYYIEYSDDEWILKRIWDSEQNWYKTRDVILREKEEKWSIDMREKLTLLQSSESSLKFTVDMLNKREII